MPRPAASSAWTVLATHAGLAALWWTAEWPWGATAARVVAVLGALVFLVGCGAVGWRQYRRVRGLVTYARADREIRRLRAEHPDE